MQPHSPSASPSGAVRSRISRIPPLSPSQPAVLRAVSASQPQLDAALSQTIPASFSYMGARALSAGDGDVQPVSYPWQAEPSPSAAAAVLSSTLPLPQRSPRHIPPMNGQAPGVVSTPQFAQTSSFIPASDISPLQPVAAAAPQPAAFTFSPNYTTSPFPLQSSAPPPVSLSSQLQRHPYAINQSPHSSALPPPPPSYPLSALPYTLPLPPPMSSLPYSDPTQQPQSATPAAALLPALPDVSSLLQAVGLPLYTASFYHSGFTDVLRILSLSPDGWSAMIDAVQADAMLRVHRGELPVDSVQLAHKAVIMQLLSNQQMQYAAIITQQQQQRSAPSSSSLPQPLPFPTPKPDASAPTSLPSPTPPLLSEHEHGHLMSGICALAHHWCCCVSIGGCFLLVSGLAYLVYQHTDDTSDGFAVLLKALCAVGFGVGACALLVAVRSWKRFPEHRGCSNATCCDGEEEDEWCWTKWSCCIACREKWDEADLCCSSAPNRASCCPAACCLPCKPGQLSCCATPTSTAPCCSLPSCACCAGNPNGPTCGNRVHDCCAPVTAGVSDCFTSLHSSVSACFASVVGFCTPKPSPQQRCCPTCPTCSAPACPCLAACWSHPCMDCCSCCECDCDAWLDEIGCGEWCTGKRGGGCCGCASELTAGCRATICYKVMCCQFKIQVN